jgi:hypothetical protein
MQHDTPLRLGQRVDDHPAPRRMAGDVVRSSTLILPIRPDTLQRRMLGRDQVKQCHGASAVLNVGRQHRHLDYHAFRLTEQGAFASRDLLAAIIATIPPCSVVFADWRSLRAAVRSGARPSFTRRRRRRAALLRSKTPASTHWATDHETVWWFGNSAGR